MQHIQKSLRVPALGAVGLLAGFVNGLLGAGGGIIIVKALGALAGDAFEDKRDIYVNALSVMMPLSALSALQYSISGQLASGGFKVYVLPAVLGGIAGALLLGKLRLTAVNRLFALLVIWSGLFMLLR